MDEKLNVRITTLEYEEVSAFSARGVWKEEDLLMRAIFDIYSKKGKEANNYYRVTISKGSKLLLIRYVVIMDFKPVVLGVINIGLDDIDESKDVHDTLYNFANMWENLNEFQKEYVAKQIIGIKGE